MYLLKILRLLRRLVRAYTMPFSFNTNGNVAPEEINGVPYLLQEGLNRVLNTRTGGRVMRPFYGLNATPLIDGLLDTALIRRTVENSLGTGLEGGMLLNITATQIGTTVNIIARVERE